MLSPLIGVSGVNSLLFGAYAVSRRVISPFPDLSISQTALAGSMAGIVNSVLAGPGQLLTSLIMSISFLRFLVELFKIQMQGQYGGIDDKRLSLVARNLWREWGFRKGIMRGFWVCGHCSRERCPVKPSLCSS